MRPIAWMLAAAAVTAPAAGQRTPPAPTPAAAPVPANGDDPAVDPMFAHPYVDRDEWRDLPVRHRWVHGGFRGTDTRFSFYFPPADRYHGRFFQHFTPVPDSETLAQHVAPGEQDVIGFAAASGGYYVETNEGGIANLPPAADASITGYRANAAAARYSRVVARAMYGGGRPFGYAYGGSGGAFHTVGAIENTEGVWDGVVPYVLGSPMAPPNLFSVRMRAMRLLRDRFPGIVDAVEPGGSGDPYAGLTPAQASVLREVTAMGFPVPSWFGWRTMGIHGFAALYGGMLAADPGYFIDFWTKPGYLGHDDPGAFVADRIAEDHVVAAPITAEEAARAHLNTAVVDGSRGNVDAAFATLQGKAAQRVVAVRLHRPVTPHYFVGGDLIVGSGAAAGRRLTIARIVGDVAVFGIVDPAVAALLRPGDAVRIDNANFLAAETYHWHQVPPRDAGYPEWDQFRLPDGTPRYPQRPFLLGPVFTAAPAGVPVGRPPLTGRFAGRMIVVENLWDREAMPWQGDWYARTVAANGTPANFRLWYVDRALHGDNVRQEDPTQTVSYLGVLEQALRDLAAWVERGVEPPAATAYRIVDGQVIVPAAAADRRGIQPVVTLRADGGAKAVVRVGEAVRLTGGATVPPGTGRIVAAEWDFGTGTYPERATVPAGRASATIATRHAFTAPGTYFATLRVTSQRDGDRDTPYARIQNLARARVVVR